MVCGDQGLSVGRRSDFLKDQQERDFRESQCFLIVLVAKGLGIHVKILKTMNLSKVNFLSDNLKMLSLSAASFLPRGTIEKKKKDNIFRYFGKQKASHLIVEKQAGMWETCSHLRLVS